MIEGIAWTNEQIAELSRLMLEGRTALQCCDYFPNRSYDSVRSKIKTLRQQAANKAGAKSDEAFIERESEVKGDSATFTASGLTEEVRDLHDLVRVCRIDTEKWEITGQKQKAYQGFHKTGLKGLETAVKVQLFSVSVTCKARTVQNGLKAELEALLDEARANMPPPVPVYRLPNPGGKSGWLASVNVTDLHMGKYAWGKESGANYTVEIAEAMLWDAVEDLVTKIRPYSPDVIVLLVGSDLSNTDNSADTTTAGTVQTTDGRQYRTLRRTWQLQRRVILRLREIAPVRVVVVKGNHDRDTSYAVGEILSVAFEGYDDVTIDNEAPRRKYVEFGKCLIGFDHGDEAKLKDLAAIVPEECAEAWGRTKWRTVETGHLHQQRVTEFPGLIVRVNPALCAPEDWHAAHAFTGKIRTCHAQMWHEDDGNLDQFSSRPADPIRAAVYNAQAA